MLQLVTLAVYSYFLAAVFGAQWVQPEQDQRFTTLYKTSIGLTVGCRHCYNSCHPILTCTLYLLHIFVHSNVSI